LYGKFLSRISAIKNATGFFRELMVTWLENGWFGMRNSTGVGIPRMSLLSHAFSRATAETSRGEWILCFTECRSMSYSCLLRVHLHYAARCKGPVTALYGWKISSGPTHH
jgi:hypothetical protein